MQARGKGLPRSYEGALALYAKCRKKSVGRCMGNYRIAVSEYDRGEREADHGGVGHAEVTVADGEHRYGVERGGAELSGGAEQEGDRGGANRGAPDAHREAKRDCAIKKAQ